MTDDRYRSRKFRLAVGCLLISAIALFTGFVTGAEWVTVVSLVIGLYGASNVGQVFAETKK